ncbi:ELM1/GtrOC1 family putative glycosyltransferase [Aestuariivirga sp.]|uniref:ELM1/GtrOC1 family putative glycosyltransferase n=1 Tax=Aestuariivirga sp. TaxID=2650926 RepID=UPI003593FF00
MAAIWVLAGSKTGDNLQVLRAVDAVGLPHELKRIVLKPGFETAKPRVTASLDIVDLQKSDALQAPWPDLVITIGRRLSLPALWIKQQSGGLTKIALFNAPKGQHDQFDLIVAPTYYQLADTPRLCRIGLPLIAADPQRIEQGRVEFAETLGRMPKPLHVLLLGGDMGRGKLDPGFAAGIVRRMRASHAGSGSIYVSTSRRTPPSAADAVAAELTPADAMFRWSPDARDNPYMGLLAHGDSFTITSDSLSMLTEVARLGKPIAIAAPEGNSAFTRMLDAVGLGRARDLDAAARHLIDGGHAVMLGEPLRAPVAPPPDDTDRVAERLRQLVLSRG